MQKDNDVPTTEANPVVRCEPDPSGDEIADRRRTPVPAIVEADEREEAGYGYGV